MSYNYNSNNITFNGSVNSFKCDNILTFEDSNGTYGKFGKVNDSNNSLHLITNGNLNNSLYIETYGGITTINKGLKLNSTLEMNGEFQTSAFTDERKTQIETNTDRITALETGSTKIFQQNNIGWNSVNNEASPWQDGSKNYVGTEKYDMWNINHTLFNSITGRWQMGTRRVLINIEASFSLPYCSVKLLQSLIRVENSSDELVHGSYSQGINRTSYTTHLNEVNYNAMLVITLNDGDKVYISTGYDVVTGANGNYTCNFNVLFNEM
jgi:hypothetical protein